MSSRAVSPIRAANAEADPRVRATRGALAAASAQRRPRLRERLDTLRAQVLLEKQGEVAREFDEIYTVERAVEVGSLDAVIPPASLRPTIIDTLDQALRSDSALSLLGVAHPSWVV